MLTLKDYSANVTVDYEDGTMHGRIVGIRDIISFKGSNPGELKQAFLATVDDYVALCYERGIAPNRPYSGRLQIRFGEKLHRQLAQEAEAKGISINKLVRRSLESRMRRRQPARLKEAPQPVHPEIKGDSQPS